jgi:tRNA A37 threonylcarbamoyltransferase TsaD
MAYFSKDQMMLQEAYTGILLEQVLPNLTLNQLVEQLDSMSESELEIVDEVIQEKFFGGLRSIGSTIAKGVSNTYDKVSKGVGNTYDNVAKGVGNTYDKVSKGVGDTYDKVSKGVSASKDAVKSGAKQFAKNTSNIYKTGEQLAQATARKEKTLKAIESLVNVLNELQTANPDIAADLGDDFMNLTLAQIQKAMKRGESGKGASMRAAQRKGFFGDVAKAGKKAFQSGFQG